MSIFDTIARGAIGGSSASGDKCGGCAAKQAEIARQAREIKTLQVHIMRCKEAAARAEHAGKVGQKLNNPPIRQGMYEGMERTGGKLKRML